MLSSVDSKFSYLQEAIWSLSLIMATFLPVLLYCNILIIYTAFNIYCMAGVAILLNSAHDQSLESLARSRDEACEESVRNSVTL